MEIKRTESTVTTVTTETTVTINAEAKLDRSNEKLIANETTFNQLLRILASNPDVVANAQVEADEKSAEAKDAQLHSKLGEDYDLVFDKKSNKNKSRRPGAIQLRTSVPRIAVIEMGDNGICEVFNNGYAVYDNGNRKVVLWVPDCGTATYYFNGLTEKEKQYLDQSSEVGLDVLGECPWYHALMIAGENRIEYNMDHPKSKGNSSDLDLEEVDIKPATHWVGGAHFDDPETAYLKKEAAEERRNALTEKQRIIYELYYEGDLTLEEISNKVGLNINTVYSHIQAVKKKFGKEKEKFFS